MPAIPQIRAEARSALIALRREFHCCPELSLQEYRMAQRIEQELDKLEIAHVRVGETGVLGTLRGAGNGRAVVLRADIDALPIQETSGAAYASETPGVMHACGHDAHIACLLGAAQLLAAQRKELCGEVRFVFQPAEEIGQGAKPFVAAGALDGAVRVFGLHVASDLPAGSVGLKPGLNNAAVDHFKITVHGRSSHVSTPHLGTDALYIASQIVVSLQALVTRMTSPVEPVIIGVGKLTAGTTYNALAETAVLEGTTRTVSQQSRDRICLLMAQTAEGIAQIYGGTAGLQWADFAAALINDPAACAEAAAVAETLFGPGRVLSDRPLSLSGDNFAEYLLHLPGAYAYLGTGNPALPNTVQAGHSSAFDVDEDTLALGAQLYAAYALRALELP